ncbi:MAG: class I SAM-dependent methyltransferase [Candidatus Heimdallarchaeota archaeon]|nr:class I SAM-dependent methyltransferase [Candidatus Heimdallarchaeota archaeon]MCK4877430.1 class I SAM-dependent methyltransferase [Candidatus Heimdallarchaeota archaeon]
MKILESAPYRYDRGIKILTLGRIDKAYDRLVENIKKDDRVLDIGCGTGMLSFRAVLRGATVTGIDINPEMLEIAKKRTAELEVKDKIEFLEMGVAEMDRFDNDSFDVIMSGLCFSELSEDEISFTLKQIKRTLSKEGKFLLADEIKSRSIFKKIINWFLRIPLVMITYILTQTTSKAIKNIENRITESGLVIQTRNSNFLDNFVELTIIKEDKK